VRWRAARPRTPTRTSSALQLLVLHHDADAPAARLAEWAAARGVALTVVRLDRGALVPDGIRAYDAVVSLGSAHAADDDSVPWQAVEQATLRAAVEAGVPVLGICFGGQALARALGGAVGRAARPEIGWVSIDSRAAGLDDGPWFEWHRDEILPPEGAEILATNASGVQAFRLGPHVGLQFHPEVDERIVGLWADAAREDAEVPPGLREQTTQLLAGSVRERAFALFDALLRPPSR
jgi:GMP synthase-like glutamine amidotransferase